MNHSRIPVSVSMPLPNITSRTTLGPMPFDRRPNARPSTLSKSFVAISFPGGEKKSRTTSNPSTFSAGSGRFMSTLDLLGRRSPRCAGVMSRIYELPLRGPCFIAVSLRVEIEGRLNPRMAQDALHRFRLDLGGVHQKGAERVTQVVKPEPL